MDTDRYAHLIDRQHILLLVGIVFLLVAVASTLTGETLQRYSDHMVRRDEEPKRFRSDVVGFYVLGILCIAIYFFTRPN